MLRELTAFYRWMLFNSCFLSIFSEELERQADVSLVQDWILLCWWRDGGAMRPSLPHRVLVRGREALLQVSRRLGEFSNKPTKRTRLYRVVKCDVIILQIFTFKPQNHIKQCTQQLRECVQNFKSLAVLKVKIEPFKVPYSPILNFLILLWFQIKWTNPK